MNEVRSYEERSEETEEWNIAVMLLQIVFKPNVQEIARDYYV